MRDVSDTTSAHMRQLRDEAPWIWLYDIEVPSDPKTRYRLTNFTSDVLYGHASDGTALIYSPIPIVHSDIQQTLEGDLPSFQLQVGGGSLELAMILEQFVGLTGANVVVRVINKDDLASPTSGIEVRGEVVACRVTAERVTIGIGALNLSEAIVPPMRFSKSFCNHAYGSDGCGYDLTNSALALAFPECAFTYAACGQHGQAEADNDLPVLHPFNWGGFKDIPRG